MTGVITRLFADKGFGFIRSEASGVEFFFHRTGCEVSFGDLREGDAVHFEKGDGVKGPRAEDVVKA